MISQCQVWRMTFAREVGILKSPWPQNTGKEVSHFYSIISHQAPKAPHQLPFLGPVDILLLLK